VVSSALSPGAKACQAAHALRAYVDAYPEIESKWWQESNTLVLLKCSYLDWIEQQAKEKGISCVRFVEPDWAPEGTLTALVLGPEGKKLVRSLKLAF
jgi:peptidyl-tRNA hydrolase